MGLLERENATIMNACLRELATHIVAAFHAALAELGIDAPVYLSQNDGTLMSVDFVERYPVATFASGPTNSMRGAAFLSGLADCTVVDIGGTTSDVGILQAGFPREASVAVDIGGIRTNFRMPDVLSLGIGGGSHVSGAEVGPQSVGYELTSRARLRRRRPDRDPTWRSLGGSPTSATASACATSTRPRHSRGSRSASRRRSTG
jgi:N-methylhydantoinase A/oxoprolinase/acetone carboxylase beta subunit